MIAVEEGELPARLKNENIEEKTLVEDDGQAASAPAAANGDIELRCSPWQSSVNVRLAPHSQTTINSRKRISTIDVIACGRMIDAIDNSTHGCSLTEKSLR